MTGFLAGFAETSADYGADEVERATTYLSELPNRFNAAFSTVDLLLSPVLPQRGLRVGDFDPNDPFSKERMAQLLQLLAFTGPVNFAGNPAMSVPLSWDTASGLPIGSHFVGRHGQERTLYELAFELEDARPWKDIWAPTSVRFAIR